MLSKLSNRSPVLIFEATNIEISILNNLSYLIFFQRLISLNTVVIVVIIAKEHLVRARFCSSLAIGGTLQAFSVALASLVFFLPHL